MTQNTHRLQNQNRRQHQDGAALAVSLILLIIITLLSVSAMRSTNLDTKISVNHQFKEASFQAAESALAIVTGPAPAPQVPATPTSPSVINVGYFTSSGVAHQADLSADLIMTYIGPSRAYKVSGFRPNALSHEYQANAIGTVDQSGTRTENSMRILLIRN
ncbi:MAG: hypothetical protein KZQ92_22575 [Candidatus Thiodiazotropha sp. (ex Lucinoma borealis)]|nr:hypothetical protein [Candidatus Thiodiazotropha sp. (ex Lucinoma borealis)]MCU7866747.1 hypothetical protein [Candidatus Thiodiazotropha sp. (ex Lucinoma borealis)]MCU7868108.1 hypothetical protein [Candidatus Thiodiazotropha sp. (ex Lucinoma borealis)]